MKFIRNALVGFALASAIGFSDWAKLYWAPTKEKG
jgi:hypothetical protein